MALFSVKSLKEKKKKHPVEIKLGHIVENGKELLVSLTVNMSKELLQAFREADDLYRASTRLPILNAKEAKRRKKAGIPIEAKITHDYVAFCETILDVGYVDCQNLLDEPSKENLFLAIEEEPGFAEQLALSLNYFFSGKGKYDFIDIDDEENLKKN